MSSTYLMSNGKLTSIESWFAFFARVIAFFLGVFILVYLTVYEPEDRLYLTVAAIGCLGPAIAQAVAAVFASIRGGPQ